MFFKKDFPIANTIIIAADRGGNTREYLRIGRISRSNQGLKPALLCNNWQKQLIDGTLSSSGTEHMVSMLIPFASLMIPLVKITTVLHINNTLPGAIIVFAGVGLAFGFFMMQSAVKTLPRELEEAAALDGCGPVRTFFCIVFPLMKNTVFSLIAMDLFWVWNDFMIPQTLLNSTKYDTIQVGINKLFGMYASKWDIALAALVMSMIPTIIAFLLLQKQILGGVSDGATKG